MWEDAIVVWFKLLSLHIFRDNEERHRKLSNVTTSLLTVYFIVETETQRDVFD